MKQWLRRHFKQYMIRPTIYKVFSYFLTALTLALLWDRFANTAGLLSISYAYTIMAYSSSHWHGSTIFGWMVSSSP